MRSRITTLLSAVHLMCLSALSTGVAATDVSADRVLVTDPAALTAMGFPADATNVHTRANPPTRSSDLAAGDFGTVANFTPIAAKAFIGRENIVGSWQYSGGDVGCCENLSRKGTEQFADAQVLLPDGVNLDFIRFWGHDANVASNMAFFVFEHCLPTLAAGAHTSLVIGQDDPVTTGSGGYQSAVTNTTRTINNRDCTYTARVRFDSTTGLTLQKIRMQWNRQISPAPATARFTDVPTTDPFFQHIEALAASGVTTGCTTTEYCPTQPVTRAQMAIFLARALGL